MKIMILDDEQLVLDNLKYILKQFSNIEIVYESTDAPDAMEKLEKIQPEALFVDIAMPVLNGLEIAERVYDINPRIKVVFITAYERYAVDAFRVNAVDYILKPVTTSKLTRTINKLCQFYPNEEEIIAKTAKKDFKIVGMYQNKLYIIPPEEGIYIKVVQRDLFLVTENQQYILKNNMNYWEKMLRDYNWFRCHRAYIVNINQVDNVFPMFNCTYNMRVKKLKDEIPVSRSYVNEFKKTLNI